MVVQAAFTIKSYYRLLLGIIESNTDVHKPLTV